MSNCKGCGGQRKKGTTRPSCIMCVQKHIGGAEALITEMRDGYRYMTKAVGEMYQAEDESQEWEKLHNYIRQSRIKYQSQLVMPDWEILNKMITRILLSEGAKNG